MICLTVPVYCGLLIAQTIARIRFPWDLYWWSESPFLVGMLKLAHHQPVYTSPEECNSFVYSPGLQYLVHAVLNPMGLSLDIRFCRLVSLTLGLGAAFCGAVAALRLIRSATVSVSTALMLPLSFGIFWLMISQNFMSDLCHPDNLHALHATALLALCVASIETRRFSLAALTMVVAGLGVFTKQTEGLSLLGPVLAFAYFRIGGTRRQLLLAAIGVLSLGISLWLLWLPKDAYYFTVDVLRHQKIYPEKIPLLLKQTFNPRGGGALAVLTLIAARWCWRWDGAPRRYLICWALMGFFCALPNVMAYIKIFGISNNLALLDVWKMLLIWPACVIYLGKARSADPFAGSFPKILGGWRAAVDSIAPVFLLAIYFIFVLIPHKPVPSVQHYAYCQAIDAAVKADVTLGKKVLVAHGATFLLHAGVTSVPMDQANTTLELMVAGKNEPLAAMKKRLEARQYDKVYLTIDEWYSPEIKAALERNYQLVSSLAAPKGDQNLIGQRKIMEKCEIWESRATRATITSRVP